VVATQQTAAAALEPPARSKPRCFALFMKKPFHLSALSLRRGNHVFLWRLAKSEQKQEKATIRICLLAPRATQSASFLLEFLSRKRVATLHAGGLD
jgi:hypothetical protein